MVFTLEWTRDKTLSLIDEYKKRPGLWDMTHDDYRKKDIKRELLDEVSNKFDRTVPPIEIEKKFHTLRTQYHREISRMNQTRGNEPYKSKWFAYKHLQFLSSPKACRGSKGNNSVRVKLESRCVSPVNAEEPPAKFFVKEVNIPIHHYGSTSQISQSDVDSSVAQCRNVDVTVCTKNDDDTRKDLTALFDDADKNVEEHSTAKVIIKVPITSFNQQCPSKAASESGYEEVRDDENLSIQDGIQYQSTPKDSKGNPTKREIFFEDVVYEPANQQGSSKKLQTESVQPLRDEFTIYGECVANELRFITNREILITVKHKINTALYEANMTQLQKFG